MCRTYLHGYSFEIEKESEKRYSFTVRHPSGEICDGGYSTTRNGAESKARRMIRLFASK